MAPKTQTPPANAETVDLSNKNDTAEAQSRHGYTPGAEIGGNKVDLGNSRDATQARLDKQSADNEEGHRKNMEAIERAHRHGHRTAPGLGREDNGLTPRIDKNGNKSWHPPGVAGAAAPADAPSPSTSLDQSKLDEEQPEDPNTV